MFLSWGGTPQFSFYKVLHQLFTQNPYDVYGGKFMSEQKSSEVLKEEAREAKQESHEEEKRADRLENAAKETREAERAQEKVDKK